jgi:hypothetical protein
MSITSAPTATSTSTSDCANIDVAAKLLGLEKNGNTIVCKTSEQCIQADLYKALCSELTVSTAIPSASPTATANSTSSGAANKANIAIPAVLLAGAIGISAIL